MKMKIEAIALIIDEDYYNKYNNAKKKKKKSYDKMKNKIISHSEVGTVP